MTKTITSCRQMLLVFASLMILTFPGCSNPQEAGSSPIPEAELVAAANRLDSLFLIAFNKGDVNAFMQLYWNSPELTAYPPTGEMQLKGYEAVKEFYTADFAANKGGKLEYTSNTNIPFKDVIIGHGTFKWTMSIPGAAPIIFEARHTVVKAIKDGRLVIVVDHNSAPMRNAAPGDSATTSQGR